MSQGKSEPTGGMIAGALSTFAAVTALGTAVGFLTPLHLPWILALGTVLLGCILVGLIPGCVLTQYLVSTKLRAPLFVRTVVGAAGGFGLLIGVVGVSNMVKDYQPTSRPVASTTPTAIPSPAATPSPGSPSPTPSLTVAPGCGGQPHPANVETSPASAPNSDLKITIACSPAAGNQYRLMTQSLDDATGLWNWWPDDQVGPWPAPGATVQFPKEYRFPRQGGGSERFVLSCDPVGVAQLTNGREKGTKPGDGPHDGPLLPQNWPKDHCEVASSFAED
jgi:hypothetical protein